MDDYDSQIQQQMEEVEHVLGYIHDHLRMLQVFKRYVLKIF